MSPETPVHSRGAHIIGQVMIGNQARGTSAPVQARRPTAIDVFSGAGGMSLGFEAAGFDVLAAVDHDPVHLSTYKHNFPLTEVLCGDVTHLTGDAIMEAARTSWRQHHPGDEGAAWDERVDCVFGGPSCQGFSFIGRNDPDDPRNELVFHFARLVKELQPRYFVMENVPGLVSPRHADVVQRLREQFAKMGYVLDPRAPVRVNAADCGVPQIRRRVFIVGARRDEKVIPRLEPEAIKPATVSDALRDVPNADDFEALLTRDSVALEPTVFRALEQRASSYAKLMRSARLGTAAYERKWTRRSLTASGRTTHTADVAARFAKLRAGELDIVSRLRRLDGPGQSPTLRAGTGRDHGSFTSSRPIHHLYPRVLTVREAARLHSFPDWFRFHVTKWHGFRQVGNAVPPLMAERIAAYVMRLLDAELVVPEAVVEVGPASLLTMSLTQAAEHHNYDVSLLPVDVRRRGQTGGVEKNACEA